MHPDVVDYTFKRVEEELTRVLSHQSDEMATTRLRLAIIERQIRNCTEAIASMGLSNSLRAQLTNLEKEQQEFTEKLSASEPRIATLQLREARRFVEAELRDLRSMWTGDSRLARAEIARHVERITLAADGRTYVASGTWDLFGSVAVTMVPGARLVPFALLNSRFRFHRSSELRNTNAARTGLNGEVGR